MGTGLIRVALEATERPNFDLDAIVLADKTISLIKQAR